MSDLVSGKIRVKKFTIDDDGDCEEYEVVLNDPTCTVIRDEFYTDRLGLSHIVVWYRDESEIM